MKWSFPSWFPLFFFCAISSSNSQVILATIERHKQNSETFNKAFNNSFSREDDHIPESPVSCLLPQSISPLISQLVGHPVLWIIGGWWYNKRVHHRLVFVCLSSSPSMGIAVSYSQNTHKEALSFHFTSHTCSLCDSPFLRTLSWPNKESSSVYKTLMDLLWPTLCCRESDPSQTYSSLTQSRRPDRTELHWHLVVEICYGRSQLLVLDVRTVYCT